MAAYASDCSQAGDLLTSLCDSFASEEKTKQNTHLIPLFLANSRVCFVLKQSCASFTVEIIPIFALTGIQEREKKKKKDRRRHHSRALIGALSFCETSPQRQLKEITLTDRRLRWKGCVGGPSLWEGPRSSSQPEKHHVLR